MLRPPTRVAPSTRSATSTPLPMGRRTERAVLAQCDHCGANGTAHLSPRGRVASINLRADVHRGHLTHRGCGGHFIAFDIEVDA